MKRKNYIKLALIPLFGIVITALVYVRTSAKLKSSPGLSANILGTSGELQSSSESAIDHEAAAPIYFGIFKFITNLAPKH